MFIDSALAEQQAVFAAAHHICAAARTAPKARGVDNIDTAILTGEDKDKLAEEMRRLSGNNEKDFMYRDAGNVDKSAAVVLVGVKEGKRGLGERCQLCHFKNCEENAANNGCCVFDLIDLGIALGSAAAMAADYRIDNRIMFTIGKAAESLELLGEYRTIMGIPLSVSGKSPYFDR